MNQLTCLLIDNASCHPYEGELVSGDHCFATKCKVSQPTDQHVLYILKLSYKKIFLKPLIKNEDNSLYLLERLKKITVKDVIYWMTES